uniref:Amino acid transporter n=1 Tax=Gasterosteus aculeatus aculeatus TaxID=481459 RepID=A0AAQ4R4C3_GASAC|nr:excitatory amino acid transporter 3-like isoform X2 [Gasterosteus aculeatus aculeatus]
MEGDANPRRCAARVQKCYRNIVRDKYPALRPAVCVLGISLGLILKFKVPAAAREDLILVGFPGEIVLNFIQAISIPFIISTIITGFSAVETSTKVGRRATAFFLSTSLLSVTSGLILVMLIQPGVTYGETGEDAESFAIVEDLLDVLWNIFPSSLFVSCFQRHNSERREADSNSGLETNAAHYVEGTNTLGLIFWSFVFGQIFHNGGNETEKIRGTFAALRFFSKSWLHYSLSFLPFGVLFLVSSQVIEFQDWEIISKLGKLIGVVHAGKVYPALLSAFLNSSSSATLPLTLQRCEEELGVDRRISRYMLPIGTKINKNGTALYEVIAVVFIAQLSHIHPDTSQLISIFVLAAVIAGTEGISSTWFLTTFFVLRAVGLPAEGAAILVVIDWLIKPCNTVVNVFGNCIAVALIHEVSKNDLEEMMESGEEMGSDDQAVPSPARMHRSNAEGLHQEDIELHILGQASDDALNTQPETPAVE